MEYLFVGAIENLKKKEVTKFRRRAYTGMLLLCSESEVDWLAIENAKSMSRVQPISYEHDGHL